jgi:phosphoglycolate phosphatase-like HAD superfamily hydrolase
MWRIHRKIGMSGGLMLKMLARETGLEINPDQAKRLSDKHDKAYKDLQGQITALPGAVELLDTLTAISSNGVLRPAVGWTPQR